MKNIFGNRTSFKPFMYPWAYETWLENAKVPNTTSADLLRRFIDAMILNDKRTAETVVREMIDFTILK